MKNQKQKLVIDGNAIYEIDLECEKKKGSLKKREQKRSQPVKSEKKG